MSEAGVWAEIGRQWRRRDDGALRELVLDLAGERAEAVAASIAVLHDELHSAPGQTAALDDAVVALLDVDPAVGAALTYLQCLVMWERSDELRQITAVADALRRAAASNGEGDALVEATVQLARALHHQLFVENAVFCSCPVALDKHAVAVLDGLDRAAGALAAAGSELEAHLRPLHGVLDADISAMRTYYEAMREVAAATGTWIDDRRSSGAAIDAAVALLRAAEHELAPDVFESELRSHRVALETMAQHVTDGELWLDRGRIVYLYPFAIPGEVPEELVRSIYEGGRRPSTLGGAEVLWVDRAIVAGSWQQDRLLGVRNELVTIALAPLSLETTSGDLVPELRPEVRLSSVGNHLVRIEVDVADLGTHELDQHLRRVGEEMGRERIRLRDGTPEAVTWPMLCDYAASVVGELLEQLRRTSDGGETLDPGEDAVDVLVAAHVVVSARRLSVRSADGEGRLCTVTELPDHLGASILLQPAREQPASLESWIRRRVVSAENLMASDGRDDELLVRTHGSTLVYLPGAAEWQVEVRDEMAEFTASLAGLLHGWSSYLGAHARVADDDLAAVAATGDADVVRARLRLLARDFSRVHSMLTQLRSANVCRQAGDRELLDRLRHAARVDDLERALHEAIGVLVAQQARLTEEAERLRLDHERRVAEADRKAAEKQEQVQFVLELGVTVLALTSVIDLLNGAYDVTGAILPLAELVLLVLLTVALVLWFRREDRKGNAS